MEISSQIGSTDVHGPILLTHDEPGFGMRVGKTDRYYIQSFDSGADFRVARISTFDRWANSGVRLTAARAAWVLGVSLETLMCWAAGA